MKSLLYLVILICLFGCGNNIPAQPFSIADVYSYQSIDSLSLRLSKEVEYSDSIKFDNNEFVIFRYLGARIFGEKTLLLIKVDGARRIIQYDWILDNISDWKYSFSTLVFENIVDNAFKRNITTKVNQTVFHKIEENLIALYGKPSESFDSPMKTRQWHTKAASVVYDTVQKSLWVTIKNTKDHNTIDTGYWMFSTPNNDSILSRLTIGAAPDEVLRVLSLNSSTVRKDTSGFGYTLEGKLTHWGIPGNILLQFSDDDKLTLCQWSFYREAWNYLDIVFLFCWQDLEKNLGKFNEYPSSGTKKNPLELAIYKVFGNRTYTLRLLANNTLVFDLLDSKIYPPARYMKQNGE